MTVAHKYYLTAHQFQQRPELHSAIVKLIATVSKQREASPRFMRKTGLITAAVEHRAVQTRIFSLGKLAIIVSKIELKSAFFHALIIAASIWGCSAELRLDLILLSSSATETLSSAAS